MGIKEARETIMSELGYTPTVGQIPILGDDVSRKILVAGGERGGKSSVGAMKVQSSPHKWDLVWLVGTTYDIPKAEFSYLIEWMDKLKQIKRLSNPEKGGWTMELLGGERFTIKSADDPRSLGQEAPTMILMCEAALCDYETYMRLSGRIAEKRGLLIMTGTFEGSLGWYPELYERGQGYNEDGLKSYSLPTWSNSHIFPTGKDDPEIQRLEREMPRDRFMERHAGVPCKPSNIVIPEFRNAIHVKDIQFNPDIDVEIAVDVGYAAANPVLAIQVVDGKVNIFDEIYLKGYVTEEIIGLCKKKTWWGSVVDGAIDFAGRQHQGMPAPIEVWQRLGQIWLKSKKVDVEGMIDLTRTMFKVDPTTNQPDIFIAPRCHGIIAELGGGKSPVEGGGTWLRDLNTGKPINKNDHALKALGYWLVNRHGYTPRKYKSNYGKIFRRDISGIIKEGRR